MYNLHSTKTKANNLFRAFVLATKIRIGKGTTNVNKGNFWKAVLGQLQIEQPNLYVMKTQQSSQLIKKELKINDNC